MKSSCWTILGRSFGQVLAESEPIAVEIAKFELAHAIVVAL